MAVCLLLALLLRLSLPSRERGLKLIGSGLSAPVVLVAPLAGARIEIDLVHARCT